MHTGRPCTEFLDSNEHWLPAYSVKSVLIHIQQLLSEPVLDRPVNAIAADAVLNFPALYEQLVRDCVFSSQRVSGIS